MNKIYISNENNPYFNVSAEHQLFLKADKNTLLYLWQNSSCVVFGRNQNVFAECNMKYLGENHILPVRRFSGGGAVFQDLGNLNFTFVTKEENANIQKYLSVIKNALSSFNVNCEFSGRNDMLCDKKKFSGHAYYTDNGNYMYHGTIMVNVNMDILSNVLKPSFLKLESKGIDSVRSRVINLSQINNSITIDKIKKAIIKAFTEVFGQSEPIKYIDKESFHPLLFEKINKDEWIYGESPRFSINIEKNFSFGNVTVSVDVTEGLINRIKIQTDSLLAIDFSKCEEYLTGTLFQENIIFEYIEKYSKEIH